MTLIQITWHDSQDHSDKWVDQLDAEAFGDVDCVIVSIGFLVRETKNYWTIAGDWDASDTDYGRVTKIAKGMVEKVEYLIVGKMD